MAPIFRACIVACIAVMPLAAQLFEEPSDISIPLTPKEKAVRSLKLVPATAAGSLIGAGFSQLTGNPEEWGQGMKGYGKRFASSFGQAEIVNTISLGMDATLKTDPRYDRCKCSALSARLGHAVLRVGWTRRDEGGETVNISAMAGYFGGAAIASQWRPDRQNTFGYMAGSAGTSMAITAGLNVVREFWPEIKKRVPFLNR